jgi:LuxR family maltose regulon positive regulatory protein
MAKTTPLVRFNQVVYQQNGQEHLLTVETSAWYSWLARVTCFIFNSDVGTFTARKESVGNQRGGYYWKAYRRRSGTLYRAYLGKSEELTLQRLNMVVNDLKSEQVFPSRWAVCPEE